MVGEDRAAALQLARLSAEPSHPCSRDVKGRFEEPVRDRASCASSLCPLLVLAHSRTPTELTGSLGGMRVCVVCINALCVRMQRTERCCRSSGEREGDTDICRAVNGLPLLCPPREPIHRATA